MPDLGDFRAAQREYDGEPVTFTVHDVRCRPAPGDETVECKPSCQAFTVADELATMPLLEFAVVADDGVDASDVAGLAAMYRFIEGSLPPGEMPRFKKAATAARFSPDELLSLVRQMIEAVTGRPTMRPSSSDGGPPAGGLSSKDGSSSPVTPLRRPNSVTQADIVPVDGLLAEAARRG